jgi:hypothetical protein
MSSSGNSVDRRPQCRGLLQDVDAVLVALDHPRDSANLALHARQAAQELRAILCIAVARWRLGRCRLCSAHTGGEYIEPHVEQTQQSRHPPVINRAGSGAATSSDGLDSISNGRA